MSRARDVASNNLALISAGSDGQILTSDGTDWAAENAPTELPGHGADGNLLTSDGSAWVSQAPAASGGAWTYISEVVSTSSTTVDFSNVFTTTYDNYRITANNVGSDTSNINLGAKVEFDGSVGSYTAYGYYNALYPNNPPPFSYSGGTIFSYHQNNTGSDAQRANFFCDIYNPRSSNSKTTSIRGVGYSGFSGIPVNAIDAWLLATSTTEQIGIQFYADSGTITGTFRLYGFATS